MEIKKGLQAETQNPNFKSYGKDSKFIAEKRKVLKLLSNSSRPLTALQVSNITDIRIQNITRHVSQLKKQNLIKVAYLGRCPISKFKNVQFLKLV